MDNLTEEQKAFLKEHERLHEIFRKRSESIFNIAMDVAINTFLVGEGYDLPEGTIVITEDYAEYGLNDKEATAFAQILKGRRENGR
jgi:predicted metal-dependent peptidase